MAPDRRTLLALTGALLAGVAGCTSAGETDDDDPDPADESPADDPPDEYHAPDFPQLDLTTDPDLENELLAAQIRGNVAFSFELLERLRDEEPNGNCFFSPYSVSVALAMTYAGARGETATEMADALRYELEDDDLHGAFGALEGELARRNEDGEEVENSAEREGGDENGTEGDLGFQLSSANAVWAEADYHFDDEYFDLLEAYYEAGERLVDFSASPEEAREEINEWVESRTEDRIEDLLPEGSIDGLTRLVLTNAVYFVAAWEYEFDPADTEPAPFAGLDGSETEVELMHQRERFQYAEIDGHQLVELPYANGDTSMVVILPAAGEFEAFEESLTVDRLATMLEETSQREVTLALPKFAVESKFSLVEIMRDLGMERAFDERDAEFSGMVEGDDSDLLIDDIIHQSFVEVDEDGTEAAAATGVVMRTTSTVEQAEMTVDRPFLFYVRDRPTETPLFVGRVVDGETLQDD